VFLSRIATGPFRHPTPTSDGQVAAGVDRAHVGLPHISRDHSRQQSPSTPGAPGYLGLSPAQDAANLLEQTRAFSRAVNELRANMEQLGTLP
jgi:hypothetical protein